MAIEGRDWRMMIVGLGIGFFLFTTVGKKATLTAMGVAESETKRLLTKLETKSKKRELEAKKKAKKELSLFF